MTTTCKNCDKPISGGTYCGRLCEDMDRHPAPRDDMCRCTPDRSIRCQHHLLP